MLAAMGRQVVDGAQLRCAKGTAPATLAVQPTHASESAGRAAATVMDFAPMANIPAFGMCTSPSNPQVASATAAAMGALTPAPCVPVVTAPWSPGAAAVTLGGQRVLVASDACDCVWGGAITITDAGQSGVTNEE